VRVATSLRRVAVFPVLMLFIDWTTHWQLGTLTSVGVP
jgi:hypothetical protein